MYFSCPGLDDWLTCCHRPLLAAPQIISLSTLHLAPSPILSCHPSSNTWKCPLDETLPVGQTLRPAEHKGWVNTSLAFFSRPTLHTEAQTTVGRIHSAINSSDQQGNNAHSWGAWHAGMYRLIIGMSSINTGGKRKLVTSWESVIYYFNDIVEIQDNWQMVN